MGYTQKGNKCHEQAGILSMQRIANYGSFLQWMGDGAEMIPTSLEAAMVIQGNLVHPTKITEYREHFYVSIDLDSFFDEIQIKLQLKERLKAMLPVALYWKIKSVAHQK